jgi:hypothetical protein
MKIGFTGTKEGMTNHQKDMVGLILIFHSLCGGIEEVHHGDCIGADDQFNDMAGELCLRRVHHPSDVNKRRAWGKAETILPTKPPLTRNHDIVDAVDMMIATPKEWQEVLRSGTWATIRYCGKQEKMIHIIYP